MPQTTRANATSACGSQKVMSIARDNATAVDTRGGLALAGQFWRTDARRWA